MLIWAPLLHRGGHISVLLVESAPFPLTFGQINTPIFFRGGGGGGVRLLGFKNLLFFSRGADSLEQLMFL